MIAVHKKCNTAQWSIAVWEAAIHQSLAAFRVYLQWLIAFNYL